MGVRVKQIEFRENVRAFPRDKEIMKREVRKAGFDHPPWGPFLESPDN